MLLGQFAHYGRALQSAGSSPTATPWKRRCAIRQRTDALREANAGLRKTAVELEAAKRAAETASNRLKSEFLANMKP